MLTPVQLALRWQVVLVAAWAGFTTHNAAAASEQQHLIVGSLGEHNTAQAVSSSYGALSLHTWDESAWVLPIARSHFGTSDEFYAANNAPKQIWWLHKPPSKSIKQMDQCGWTLVR